MAEASTISAPLMMVAVQGSFTEFVVLSRAASSTEAAPMKETAKEAAADDEDDDLDLFGDETEEEKNSAEERDQAKASTKKKESGKSSVLMDIKSWDDETDMKKLEEVVRSVELLGLLWGASKLVPVGYGIKRFVCLFCSNQIQEKQSQSYKKLLLSTKSRASNTKFLKDLRLSRSHQVPLVLVNSGLDIKN
ncbi:hypothetical protein SSX86_030041 [Deinandra increscens subsp. villosa]|uniref:Translation elongation factor EF1B beta/delta subunit guanine nucleotide exchange domain-containing protein n=1 Tax=Deinandra increscens subsp. villosa TaxID=3103831 RepID=A0AAP0CGT4_9ASTR